VACLAGTGHFQGLLRYPRTNRQREDNGREGEGERRRRTAAKDKKDGGRQRRATKDSGGQLNKKL
jgi:hypothetical protein